MTCEDAKAWFHKEYLYEGNFWDEPARDVECFEEFPRKQYCFNYTTQDIEKWELTGDVVFADGTRCAIKPIEVGKEFNPCAGGSYPVNGEIKPPCSKCQ